MKTVKEWFAQLPEPYGTDCLGAALYYDSIMDLRESLGDAIAMSIPSWPGLDIEDLIKRANSGEFDKPSIPWPDEADWIKCPAGTFARAVDKNGECFFFSMFIPAERIFIGAWAVNTKDCGIIADMSGVDWEKSLEYRPSIFQK